MLNFKDKDVEVFREKYTSVCYLLWNASKKQDELIDEK